jgi:hypothetical protein
VCRYKYNREAVVDFAAGSDFDNTVFALGIMALACSGSIK